MRPVFAWTLAIFNTILVMVRLADEWTGLVPSSTSSAVGLIYLITVLAFSNMGAFIVVRTEGNRVGWLMLMLGFVLADPFRTYLELNLPTLQGELSPLMMAAFWTQGWLFFISIFAIFWILLHFPDGRPPAPRWNLVNTISIFALVQFILVYTFQPKYGDADLSIGNPIALLGVNAEDTISGLIFGLGMIFLGISSLVSLYIRFRRAGPVVRAQIKWLLFAGVLAFLGIGYRLATYNPAVNDWTDYLLAVSLILFPIAISISILRYRLYDIDLIIRRTLQYALLTGILALVYFGGVVVVQGVFRGVVGSGDSPLATVISTLLIAALFNPVRARTQNWVDRRFYRAKYDAEKAMADFARSTRDEVDIGLLTTELIQLVENTIQPKDISLLLLSPPDES